MHKVFKNKAQGCSTPLIPRISNRPMMPACHQRVRVEESETPQNMQLYATSRFQVQPIVPCLDYYSSDKRIEIKCGASKTFKPLEYELTKS